MVDILECIDSRAGSLITAPDDSATCELEFWREDSRDIRHQTTAESGFFIVPTSVSMIWRAQTHHCQHDTRSFQCIEKTLPKDFTSETLLANGFTVMLCRPGISESADRSRTEENE